MILPKSTQTVDTTEYVWTMTTMTMTMTTTSTATAATYEASRGRHQPDPVLWSPSHAVRDDAPFRLLHHQQGVIGHVKVQLVEANSLQRSYWTALGLVGLSKSHGHTSPYVTLALSSSSSFTSPVIQSNNNPIWQQCEATLPLHKGSYLDGAQVMIAVTVMEDSTAVEGMVPFMGPSDQDRILGEGQLDITPLCRGMTDQGELHVNIMDVWVPIYKQQSKSTVISTSTLTSTGRVRLLLTYQPHGMQPLAKDLVALEAFARTHPTNSTIAPILPPLHPMRVLHTQGTFLLVEYTMPSSSTMATMRLHRNAVFTIERSTLFDTAWNVALFPAKVLLATPLGQDTVRWASPVVHIAADVFMPALLSVRLVVAALQTTGMAAWSGVGAATQAVLAAQLHQRRHQQQPHQHHYRV